MRKVTLYALVALSAVLVACTTVVVKDSGPEILLPGKFVESADPNIVLVHCVGKGSDLNNAINNARKGCLEWMITNNLAQKQSERQAYMSQQKSIFAKMDRYVALPPNSPASGKGKGIKSRNRLSDDEIKVEIVTEVHKKPLVADLTSMGIIQSIDETLASVGKPSFMVMPSKASKGSKLRGVMQGLAEKYIAHAGYEYFDPQGAKDAGKLMEAFGEIMEAEEDEAAQTAAAVGADVYMVYEGKRNKKGDTINYSVVVSAYETASGNKIGTEDGSGPARADWVAGEEDKALKEPLNDCMGKLIPLIEERWKKNAPKGVLFNIIFRDAPPKTHIKMGSVLKKRCAEVKMISKTSSSVAFLARCKMDNLELAGVLDEGVSAKFEGSDYDTTQSRNAILLQFK